MAQHYTQYHPNVVIKRETPIQLTDKCVDIVRGDGTIDDLLFDLLVRATPYGHEARVRDEVIIPFVKSLGHSYEVDEKGNLIVTVGENFTTMFSAHMDTVHGEPKDLKLVVTANGPVDRDGMVYATSLDKNDQYVPSVLGADDKVGCYILMRLMENKTPGLYVFHVGEERGCIGSVYITEKTPEVITKHGIKRAVAFDRRGYSDVIYQQRGSRSASHDFCHALSNELSQRINLPKHQFKPAIGVYTDTARYTYIVQECTNISCGYFSEHSDSEHFDNVWLELMFIPALLGIDWENLPTVKELDKPYSFQSYGSTYRRRANQEARTGSYVCFQEGKARPSEIEETTPLNMIPDWEPEKGIPYGIKPEGFKRMIHKWIMRDDIGMTEIIDMIAKLNIDIRELCWDLSKAVKEKEEAEYGAYFMH